MKPISVIKLGGSLGQNSKAQKKFFKELSFMARKESIVLVHGGGPEVTKWLQKVGLKSRFINGLRYTDKNVLEVVEMILSGKENKRIVAELSKKNVAGVGISGKDGKTVICKRIKKLGFVGEPYKTNVKLLKLLLHSGYLPVVSSLGVDPKGQTLNVNSDSMAQAIATGLKARKLILLTNVPGVMGKNGKVIHAIKTKEVQVLIKSGVITGGMIPKIKASVDSIKKGVKEVVIADGHSGIKKLQGTKIYHGV
ncbi:MAG: acetylglutamate kinase [Endomicrobiales bacterium]|nr:acetylglutamate kinase [Endomicrobiales bacterium]